MPILVTIYILVNYFDVFKWYILVAFLLGLILGIYKYNSKEQRYSKKYIFVVLLYPIGLPIMLPTFVFSIISFLIITIILRILKYDID